MYPRLERLGWFIQRASCVSSIWPTPIDLVVVRVIKLSATEMAWGGKIA
jgi:hypothetical protein